VSLEIIGKSKICNETLTLFNKQLTFNFTLPKISSFMLDNGIINEPIKDFRKFSDLAKLNVLAAASSFFDSSASCSPTNSGIIGINSAGAIDSNYTYFKDYYANGRTLGRGNLFVYTLPSSLLSVVSISLGIKGPIIYSFKEKSFYIESQVEDFAKCYDLNSIFLIHSNEEVIETSFFRLF